MGLLARLESAAGALAAAGLSKNNCSEQHLICAVRMRQYDSPSPVPNEAVICACRHRSSSTLGDQLAASDKWFVTVIDQVCRGYPQTSALNVVWHRA